MIPEVGSTCKFFFTARFATLNGIYKIRAETTFSLALLGGVDFVNNLYVPAGLQASDYNNDYTSFLNDTVAVIESVTDSATVYNVPESLLLGIPDPTVKEYLNMIAVVTLGVQQNNQAIYPLMDQIKDLIQSTLGTTDPLRIMANTENKIYLTDAEYITLQAVRQANIAAIAPSSVQIQTLKNENTYLAAKVAAYEALITELATGVSPSP